MMAIPRGRLAKGALALLLVVSIVVNIATLCEFKTFALDDDAPETEEYVSLSMLPPLSGSDNPYIPEIIYDENDYSDSYSGDNYYPEVTYTDDMAPRPSVSPEVYTNRDTSLSLPSAYMSESLTPVEDQLSDNTSFIFASLGAVEQTLIGSDDSLTNDNTDLSEYHAKLSILDRFKDGKNKHGAIKNASVGGSIETMFDYLTLSGVVDESSFRYPYAAGPNTDTDTQGLLDAAQVSTAADYAVLDIEWLSARYDYSDDPNVLSQRVQMIKEAVYRYGSAYTGIYFKPNSERPKYHNEDAASLGDMPVNMALTVVGWDDSFYHYAMYADNPGAFICKSSTGTTYTDDGYIYVSYESCDLGSTTAVVRRARKTLPGERVYSNCAMNDITVGQKGYGTASGNSGVWVYTASRFESSEKQEIKTVSFRNAVRDTEYKIYLLEADEDEARGSKTDFMSKHRNERVLLTSGVADNLGVHCADIPASADAIIDAATKDFYIILATRTPEGVSNLIPIQYAPDEELGVSFISSNNGTTWYDNELPSKVNINAKGDFTISCRTIPCDFSVTLDSDSISLNVGESAVLTATSDAQVSFATSNPDVVTVSADGNSAEISAVSTGYAEITATAGQSIAKCTVYVDYGTVSVTGVSLDRKEATIVKDSDLTLSAFVAPGVASNRSVSWSSSNSSVARVNDGVVTAMAVGEAVITVTTADGGFTDSCTVTVIEPVSVTGVSLEAVNFTLLVGTETTFNYDIIPFNATNSNVTFSSSDPAVIAFDGEAAHIVGEGSATVTITTEDGGYQDSVTVNTTGFDDTPMTLNGEVNSYNSVCFTWEPVQGATVYQILREIESGSTYTSNGSVTFDAVNNGEAVRSYTMTGLTMGKNYRFRIIAKYNDSNGNLVRTSSNTSQPIILKPLVTVKNFKAARYSYNKIKLTWSKASGASGYVIYRATSENGKYSAIKTLSSSYTSYTNSSLTCGKTYYYKIRPYKTVSKSRVYGYMSEVLSAKPYLSAPTVTLANSYYRVKVSWNSISGATGYVVYRSDSENGVYKALKKYTNTKKKYYYDTTVVTGKTYYYIVAAYRSSTSVMTKSLPKSRTATLTTPSVTAAGYNYTTNKISWKQITGATGYEVYRSDSADGSFTKISTITSGTRLYYLDSGRSFGTTSHYKVRAVRTYLGETGYSALSAVKATKPILTKPTLSLSKVKSKVIKVTVGAVPGADGYQIYRSTKKSSGYKLVATLTDPAVRVFTNTGLSSRKNYYYRVRAYKELGGVTYYSALSSYKYKRA